MGVAFDSVAAGDERSVDGICVDIDVILVFQPGYFTGHRGPVVIHGSVVEVPIVVGVFGIALEVGAVFCRLEGGEEETRRNCDRQNDA